MARPNPDAADVVVIDLTRGGGVLAPPGADTDGADRRVVTLDDVARLVEHAPVYRRLVDDPRVLGIVCLAVGPPTTLADGVVLQRPAVLLRDKVALLWLDSTRRGGMVELPRGASGLVEVLCHRDVFDEVRKLVAGLPDRAGGPTLRRGRVALELGEVRRTWSAVARELTVQSQRLADPELRAQLGRMVGDPTTGAALADDAPVRGAQQAVKAAVETADESLRRLGSWSGVLGRDRRGHVVAAQVQSVQDAVAAHRRSVAEVLAEIDRHLRFDEPTAAQLVAGGLPSPAPVGTDEFMATVRALGADRVGEDSLPQVVDDLRREARWVGARGCATEADAMANAPDLVVDLPRGVAPLSWGSQPRAAVACAAAAFGADLIGGAVAVALWVIMCWLLRARWPHPRGRCGALRAFVPALVPAAIGGGLGVLGGLGLRYLLATPLAVGWVLVAVVLAVLVLIATLDLWSTAERYRTGMQLPRAREAAAAREVVLRGVLNDPWWLSERRRTLASMLARAAAVLDLAMALLARAAWPDGVAERAELAALVRADIEAALDAGVAVAIGTQPTELRPIEELLPGYERRLTGPAVLDDPGASPASQRLHAAVLAGAIAMINDPFDREDWHEMAELMDRRSEVVRFCPAWALAALRTTDGARTADAVIPLPTGDHAGALRLQALRAGSVRTEEIPATGVGADA